MICTSRATRPHRTVQARLMLWEMALSRGRAKPISVPVRLYTLPDGLGDQGKFTVGCHLGVEKGKDDEKQHGDAEIDGEIGQTGKVGCKIRGDPSHWDG